MTLGVIILGALVFIGFKFSRFGVESPRYTVVEKDGAFEIRDYPAMVLVSTGMENANPNEGTSFMRLFRYISGDNERDIEKFEMANAKLMGWLRQRNYVAQEQPMIANYDPPYTPWFLKRNEVLVRITK